MRKRNRNSSKFFSFRYYTNAGIRICMLGLPNKVPHADFMSRYSIIAPKIFSDMAGDARGCAAKALVEAGLDADEFRCGSTKVRYHKDGYKHILGVRVCRGWGSGFVVGEDLRLSWVGICVCRGWGSLFVLGGGRSSSWVRVGVSRWKGPSECWKGGEVSFVVVDRGVVHRGWKVCGLWWFMGVWFVVVRFVV